MKMVDTRAFLFCVTNGIIQTPNNAIILMNTRSIELLNLNGIMLVKLLKSSTAQQTLILMCVHHNVAIQSANLTVLK